MSDATTRADAAVIFGVFEFRRSERLLLRSGQPVSLGARAFDLLAQLIEHRGEVLSQRTLTARVWPGAHVADSALRVHVTNLRKAMGPEGARYVLNIPGRGYTFVAPSIEESVPSSDERSVVLPARPRGMVGRDAALADAALMLSTHRFVTLIGPGGIGKTTLATALLYELQAEFDVVGFVDLGPVHDPRLVASSIASSLGLPASSRDVAASVQAFLKDRKALLVVDNCEHVIASAAAVLEQLFLGAPELSLIATSREALQAIGEQVVPVRPLQCPPLRRGLAAHDVLQFPAAQHFMSRARAAGHGSELTDTEAAAVARICRDLDGVPLALEIAAGGAAAYGLAETAAMLDSQLKLAWRGRRTAAPRQQTLRATLDWSYGLITEADRALLRRLAVFPGEFPLDAAQTVAAAGELSEAHVLSRLPELVAKSLISAEVSGPRPNYRLLHTTRTYALAKLQEAGEGAATSRRHADYIMDRFRSAEQEAHDRPVSEWLADYRPRLDDLRTALDWAMGPDGDAELGVSLTAAGVPLFTSLSLLNEFHARAELALARTGGEAGGEREMKLFAAMANVLVNTRGPSAAAAEACTKALTIAERIGDLDYQMRALLALWNDCFSSGQIRRSLELAQKFSRAAHASERRGDILVSHRLLGVTQYVAGEAEQARVNLQATVDGYATAITESHMARFVFEQQASSRGLLGSLLMFLGEPGSAMKAIRQSVEEAIASEHALTICGVLGTTSVPVALHVGDLESAAEWGARLLETAQEHGYASWIALGRSFDGLLRLRRGELAEGVDIITAALVGVDRSNSRYPQVFCEYAEALAETGDVLAAHALLDDALSRAQARQEIWYVPEYLRHKARLIRRSQPDEAEAQLVSAFGQAEALGGRTWGLRIAADLAELRRDAGRIASAWDVLAPIVRSFTDGFETEDLRRARLVLSTLG